MKNLLFKISLFLPIPLLISSINYYVDPAALFKNGQYELGIAQIILTGQNVAGASDFDERIYNKYIIGKSNQKRGIIALGSSRILQVSTDIIPDKTFFNHGVSGATIEDLIAIYNMYRKKDAAPDMVILGVDPWMFNINNDQKRWKSIEDDYDDFLKSTNFIHQNKRAMPAFSKKYLELFSVSYFQESIKDIFKMNRRKYFGTKDKFGKLAIIQYDGARNYPESRRGRTKEEILFEAKKRAHKPGAYSLGNFKEMDRNLLSQFEMFVKYLKNEKKEVVLLMAPYHPYMYDIIVKSKNYQIVTEVEDYLRNFAESKNIPLIGSYNPKKINFQDLDFIDDMHPRRESINELLKRNIALFNISNK